MYVHYFEEEMMNKRDNPSIGIVLKILTPWDLFAM